MSVHIRNMQPMHIMQRTGTSAGGINLTDNTNPYADEYGTYPDPHHVALRQHLLTLLWQDHCDKHGHTLPCPLTADNMILTHGAYDALDLAFRTFCSPWRLPVTITPPAFPGFANLAAIYDCPVRRIPLCGHNYDRLPIEKILASNPQTLVLCNPNNPVGSALHSADLAALLAQYSGLLIIDEAYIEFSDQPSAVGLVSDHHNVIVLRTLSKAWGQAGLRCGMAIAAAPCISAMRAVQQPFAMATPVLAAMQQFIVQAERIRATWPRITATREQFAEQLRTMRSVSWLSLSQAPFVCARFYDARSLYNYLLHRGIYTHYVGSALPDALRISIGTAETMEACYNTIRAFESETFP